MPWAAGPTAPQEGSPAWLHFDGTNWQVVPSGNPPAAHGVLESVAGTTPGQPLWVTGPGTTIETATG